MFEENFDKTFVFKSYSVTGRTMVENSRFLSPRLAEGGDEGAIWRSLLVFVHLFLVLNNDDWCCFILFASSIKKQVLDTNERFFF
jgi:hypothetical protein